MLSHVYHLNLLINFLKKKKEFKSRGLSFKQSDLQAFFNHRMFYKII